MCICIHMYMDICICKYIHMYVRDSFDVPLFRHDNKTTD